MNCTLLLVASVDFFAGYFTPRQSAIGRQEPVGHSTRQRPLYYRNQSLNLIYVKFRRWHIVLDQNLELPAPKRALKVNWA